MQYVRGVLDRRPRALSAIFSDRGKLYVADPYTFLFAFLMVVIFGAGYSAVVAYIARRPKAVEQ
jgi:putative oxidoreductase